MESFNEKVEKMSYEELKYLYGYAEKILNAIKIYDIICDSKSIKELCITDGIFSINYVKAHCGRFFEMIGEYKNKDFINNLKTIEYKLDEFTVIKNKGNKGWFDVNYKKPDFIMREDILKLRKKRLETLDFNKVILEEENNE